MKKIKMTTAIKTALASAAVGVASLFQSVYAALPEGVDTAMTAAKTDAVELGGLALLVIIAIVAIKYLRRAA